MTFEELKEEFKNNGFQIDGNSFVNEFEDPHTVINGVHPKKRFEMTYICEGSIRDAGESEDSDCGEVIYQFDVLGKNREPVVTLCIGSFEDFTKLI